MPPNASPLLVCRTVYLDKPERTPINMTDCITPEHAKMRPTTHGVKQLRFCVNITFYEVSSDEDARDARMGTWAQDAAREGREHTTGKHLHSPLPDLTEVCTHHNNPTITPITAPSTPIIISPNPIVVSECIDGCDCAVCSPDASWIDWVLTAQARRRGVPCTECQ
eukprot:Ihof_evm2s1017 gene=Ihof_evmTU2s1017